MPLDAQALWDRGRVLLAGDMVGDAPSGICPLEEIPDRIVASPLPNIASPMDGRVGFHRSVSRPLSELQ